MLRNSSKAWERDSDGICKGISFAWCWGDDGISVLHWAFHWWCSSFALPVSLMQFFQSISSDKANVHDSFSNKVVDITFCEQFSSVAQSWPTLCNPMDCSTPGLPVHHQLPKFTQTHVHWVGNAIQLSHPLSSLSPPAFNLSQNQSLSQWVGSLHQVRLEYLQNWLLLHLLLITS